MTTFPPVHQADPTHVSLNNAEDVRYWTGRFGISELKLSEALECVGNDINDIGNWLEQHRWKPVAFDCYEGDPKPG